MVIFTILVVNLLNGLSGFQNDVFHSFVLQIVPSTKEIQSLDLDLIVQVIHRLLDGKIFFKQDERNLWGRELFWGCFMLYIKYRDAFRMFGPNVFHNKLGPCDFINFIRLFLTFGLWVVLALVFGPWRRNNGLSLDLWLISMITWLGLGAHDVFQRLDYKKVETKIFK